MRGTWIRFWPDRTRSEEHTSELQSHHDLVCRLLLEKKHSVHHRTVGLLNGTLRFQSETVFDSESRQMLVRECFEITRNAIESSNVNDFFFFNDTATTEIYTLSLHDALPI